LEFFVFTLVTYRILLIAAKTKALLAFWSPFGFAELLKGWISYTFGGLGPDKDVIFEEKFGLVVGCASKARSLWGK